MTGLLQPQTPSQESHSASSTVTAKGKRKAMCEPEEISLPRTPHLAQAKPQIYPQFSPDNIAIRYSPKLAQRMQRDTCFKCQQQGHWAVDCPLKSSDAVKIYCRCGHGFCEVRTSNSERNKGRKYYVCPIRKGKKCSNWIRWCDDPASESELRPPPYKYPECGGCHAGVCRKVKEVKGPGADRYYFCCPVPPENGNCGFRLWEDDVPKLNTANVVRVRKSCQKTLHYFWEPTDVKNADSENCAAGVVPARESCRRTLPYSRNPTDDNNDLNEGADLNLEHSKRMKIMDDSQHLPTEAGSKLPNGDDTVLKDSWTGDALHLESFKRMKIMDGECAAAAMAAPMEKGEHDGIAELATPTKSFSFAHLESDDDLSDEVLSSVPWEEIIEKNNARKESRVTSPSEVRRLDVDFDDQSPDVPDSPSGILSNDGCSIPDMVNASPIPSCSEIEKPEQPTGKNEATSSQEEFRKLKLEVKGLKEMVTALISLMPSHLSNVPINDVLSAAVQQNSTASAPPNA